MFNIDVLGSKNGDCLVISWGAEADPKRMLVDCGPGGVYHDFLRPYLEDLGMPVQVELAMVSHIDQDHILGLLQLTSEILRADPGDVVPAEIDRFWFNSFSDLTGGADSPNMASVEDSVTAAMTAGQAMPFEALREAEDHRAEMILAGLGQGRRLRDNLEELGLDGNRPLGGPLVLAGKEADLPGDMHIFVTGPSEARATELQQHWNPNLDPAEIAAMVDKSVANLSSIVAILTHDGRTVLLTGDARGDDILEGLHEHAGKTPGAPMNFDVLKAPHHGSDRNVDQDFFEQVTADTYVFCSDGTHDNPDPETLEWLHAARPDGGFNIVFSSFIQMEKSHKQPRFNAALRALEDSGVTIRARRSDDLAIRVQL